MIRHVDSALSSPRLATAVAIAAPIDPQESTIIGWPDSPFPDGFAVLGPVLGIADGHPLKVDNDVNWATLAEQRLGQFGDGSDFLFVYLGAGIGAGLYLSGQVHRGFRGLAGEIAFTRMETGETLMHKLANSIIGTSDGWGGSIDTARAIAMFGDPRFEQQLQPIVHDLALVIANIATVVDPRRIVIGGPLSEAPALIDALRRDLRLPSLADVSIAASCIGREAPLNGAALGALELARQRCTSGSADAIDTRGV